MLRATKADSPRRSKRQYLEGTRPELVKAAWQFWWALQDLNLGPTDYESAALTAELRARDRGLSFEFLQGQVRGFTLSQEWLNRNERPTIDNVPHNVSHY